jgi:hypothetical protein
MKKYLGLLFVLALIFSVGNIAKAEESTTGSNSGFSGTGIIPPRDAKPKPPLKIKPKIDERKPKEGEIKAIKEDFKLKREEAKTKMKGLRDQLKGEKDAAKLKIKEARIAGREKALEKFDGAIKRMTALKDKINEHIAKLEVKGVNVDDAKKFVATAQEKIDAADAKIAEMNALLATSIDQLNADNKTKFRTLAKETQALIKEAHTALKDAVKSLKGQVKVKVEEEKTIETNTVQ